MIAHACLSVGLECLYAGIPTAVAAHQTREPPHAVFVAALVSQLGMRVVVGQTMLAKEMGEYPFTQAAVWLSTFPVSCGTVYAAMKAGEAVDPRHNHQAVQHLTLSCALAYYVCRCLV
jgi:hypothetical protein